jgi:RHS repeat-associated protein
VVQKGNSQPISVTDYYPFGEQLPSRTNGNDLYRYAFQGQELDKETGMEAFQLRLWDGRIGRWLSTDPYGQFDSPYLGMGNNPISMIDPDGGYCYDSNGNSIKCGDSSYNNKTNHQVQLEEVVITGPPKSTAYKVADVATDFIPVVGGAKDIYKGWKSGNPWQVAMGVGFIAFDLATLGSGSLIRGSVKTVGKELLEVGTEQSIKLLSKGAVPNAGGKIVSFTTKETEIYYRVFSKSPQGSFLTKIKPSSRGIAREGLSLPSVNTAKYIQEVIVPAGTRLQRSRALPAFGKRGGLEQFQILNHEPNIVFGKGVKF